MNADRIQDALEVMAWFSQQMMNLPEHREEAIQLSLHSTILNLAMGEYLLRVLRGDDPYDALRGAAVGKTVFDQSQIDMLRSVVPPEIWKQSQNKK